jgi:hypothetical protein
LVAADAEDPKKQLDWEARQRPRAGVAAVLGALALIASLIGQLQLGSSLPSPSGLRALQRGVHKGVDSLPSLQIPRFEYLVAHQTAVIGLGVVGLIGSVATAWALGFLAVAARARQPTLRRWAVYLPIVGGVLTGLWSVLGAIAEVAHDKHFLDGARTVGDAASSNGLLVFTQYLGFFGTLLLAGGYVLVSLNAMRAGLITRAFGVIGSVAGVMVILPILGPLSPMFEIIFLAGLSLLFFRAWAGGIPPAWDTGRAEPWPTRERAPRRPAGRPAPAAEPAAQPPVPAGPRRKRKKRR